MRLLLAIAVLVGATLRLWEIRDQLLVSDEWHALHASAQASYGELLRLVTLGATSIPQNLYTRALLDGPGWNELLLRLPSLVAGVASLVLFPLVVRDLLRPRATLLFAFLIAVSPLLIFYARYSRPYSLVVLLSFPALIACYRWAVSGRVAAAVVFAGCGMLAGYLHVSEIRSIVLPLLLLLAVRWAPRSIPNASPVRPSFAAIALAGAAPLALLALLLLPGFLGPTQYLTSIAGRAHPDASTLLGTTALLAGTANPVARLLFIALAALGFGVLFRRDGLLGGLLLLTTVSSVAMVFITRPLEGEQPLTLARYMIAAFPIVLMAVACGLDAVLRWMEGLRRLAPGWSRLVLDGAAAGSLLALFWLGPLPKLYAGRNSFTNHKAFQASYGSLDATYTRGFRRLVEQVDDPEAFPAFYRRLAADAGCAAVIEYPLPIGDVYSLYFLYQARHGKRVIGGYFHAPGGAARSRPGVVLASWTVDEVLAAVRDPAKLRFRNLVNLRDPAAIRASGACCLIVHTDLDAEFGGERAGERPAPVPPPEYVRRFGAPAYADALTTVFDLRDLAP